MNASIVRIFIGADLRCSHDGLGTLATKHKINLKNLERGEFVIFVNNDKDKIKLYAGGDVLAYYRLPRGEHLDMGVIAKIPAAFLSTGKINYDEALKEFVVKQLAEKKHRKLVLSPLLRARHDAVSVQ